MATAIKGFEAKRKFTGSQQLPVGGYVLKILEVKEIKRDNGDTDRLDVRFDVDEGDLAGFFKDNYESNPNEDKKWKGRASIWWPKDDDDEKGLERLNDIMACFEDSNKGFSWDWNEKKLIGKKIGALFRTVHTIIEDRNVSYTEFAWFTDAESIRTNKFKIPADKYKNGASASTESIMNEPFMQIPAGDMDSIPF